MVPHKVTYRLALLNNDIVERHVTLYDLGSFTDKCIYCGTIYFQKEQSRNRMTRCSCCSKGAVQLPQFGECPPELHYLLVGDDPICINYRTDQ